jgi:hypothetical protein
MAKLLLATGMRSKIYFFICNDCAYSYVFVFKISARGEIEAQGSNI